MKKKNTTAFVVMVTALICAVFAGGCDIFNPVIDEWWVGPEGGGGRTSLNTPINYYTITFKSNCGSGTGGDYIDLVNDPDNNDPAYIDPPAQKILAGTKANEPGLVEKSNSFIFGWYTDDNNDGIIDGSDTKWDFNTMTPSGDMTLYPRWETNGYTIKFNLNTGGTPIVPTDTTYHNPTYNTSGLPREEKIAIAGTDVGKLSIPKWFGIKETSSRYDGYVFKGWYKEPGCTTEWDFSTSPTEADDALEGDDNTITLYAKWDIRTGVSTWDIEFDSDGGSSTPPTLRIPRGQKIPPPDGVTKEDYVFTGWYEDGSNTPYDFNTPPADNLKLYAKWTPEPYTDPWFDGYSGLYTIKDSGKQYIPFQVVTGGSKPGDWVDTGADLDNHAALDKNEANAKLVRDLLNAHPSWVARIEGYEDSPGDNDSDTKREIETYWFLNSGDGAIKNPDQLIINTKLPAGYSEGVSPGMIIGPNESEGVVESQPNDDEIRVYLYIQ